MIVVQVSDSYLKRAVLRVAPPEEDVVVDSALAVEAIERGFPRLVVRDDRHTWPTVPSGVRLFQISGAILARWEVERRAVALPSTRLDYLADRVGATIDATLADRNWVDTAFADLTRAAGRRLPAPLRAFGRRILEFPSHYTSLHPLAQACGTSRGALKARFRRRGLSTPSTYGRWFRIMAVSHVLSDRSVTVAEAASRLGFTSAGNMCRMMWNVVQMTPTEVRSLRGWNRLLITFAWSHLTPELLESWSSLDELFERKTA
ncbi:MAG: AraC family transcriptional regulator [Gemmatimonadota bacterium]|nr:AraC family transcriptional regulator [Gemmatimonadota bacterium]